MGESAYPNVFRPITIGGVTVRNRLVMPAHTTNYGVDHLPSDRHVAYHEARARGGTGLIIFESIRVHPSTLGKPQGIAGFDPACIEPFRRVADAVHRHGAKLFGQIISLGRQVDGDAVRVVPWGPARERWSLRARPSHIMDEEDRSAMIEGHVVSSLNVLEAGLDGLEIHLGHGHLLQQFLSPASNTRTDAYGGSEENRLRFPIEVLQAVRGAVGPDVCMGIRISGEEYVDGGLTLSDMQRIVPAILDAVPVDFVNISHSAYHDSRSLATQMADMAFTEAPFRD
ncbi:MAG TPA: NADH-dependent flavin oxidoreductase, partial [Acidimicrobiia bacterium]|nr:NADH-dependent flavin oxidoreductase [Acidimicrobiia bacterium]